MTASKTKTDEKLPDPEAYGRENLEDFALYIVRTWEEFREWPEDVSKHMEEAIDTYIETRGIIAWIQ